MVVRRVWALATLEPDPPWDTPSIPVLPPALLVRYTRRILSSSALARNKKTIVVSMAQYGVDINRVAALSC